MRFARRPAGGPRPLQTGWRSSRIRARSK
jgi:hypothetical protein